MLPAPPARKELPGSRRLPRHPRPGGDGDRSAQAPVSCPFPPPGDRTRRPGALFPRGLPAVRRFSVRHGQISPLYFSPAVLREGCLPVFQGSWIPADTERTRNRRFSPISRSADGPAFPDRTDRPAKDPASPPRGLRARSRLPPVSQEAGSPCFSTFPRISATTSVTDRPVESMTTAPSGTRRGATARFRSWRSRRAMDSRI